MDAVNRTRRAGGFTLLELMITFAVAAVGLTALMLMQIQALDEGSRGKHRTGASTLARDQMERIQNMPFSHADLAVMDPPNWTTPPWIDDPALNPGEVAVQVTQPGGDVQELVYTVFYRVTEGASDDLRRVDLEVVWTEAGVPNNKPTRTGLPTAALSTILVDNNR